jgi:hypothetical protein
MELFGMLTTQQIETSTMKDNTVLDIYTEVPNGPDFILSTWERTNVDKTALKVHAIIENILFLKAYLFTKPYVFRCTFYQTY